ncbi:MAG: hypothetical protein MUC89_07435 [Acetobacteraceae bacterium]|nr:hypothetical protein [Acetobacteraceae bacterium]
MTVRRHTMSRRTLLAATAAAPLAAPLPLRASTYPERPLTVLVPFATGGYNDRYSRRRHDARQHVLSPAAG